MDVIVPVYRGLAETRRCLDSVLANAQNTPLEIVIINDCSPDEDITKYLSRLVELHNVNPICPQYNLARVDGRYCGEPDTAGCTACLAERPAPWGLDILSWRTRFRRLLTGAARVIVPSHDMLKRMQSYVLDARYVYLPHPESATVTPPMPSLSDLSGELKIAVLGRLTPAKGLYLLEACAADARARGLPLFFRVIGRTDRETLPKPDFSLSFSGPYDDDELPSLIARERPDLVFFPAQWPETYSYTLSVAMRTALPIIAPRLGAFSERLAEYPQARLLNWDTPPEGWNNLLMSFWRGHDQGAVQEDSSHDV